MPFYYLSTPNITFELSGRAHGAVGTIVETGAGELSAVASCYVPVFIFTLFACKNSGSMSS
jgi:hypothetical protein